MPSDATDRKLARSQNPMSTQPPPKITESLPCPRCDSTSTKFCYYNNYNLSQPRHFCKSCRRYWTQGGILRNIPVGGGTRKNSKRTCTTSSFSSSSSSAASASATIGVAVTTNSSSCSSTVTHEHVPVSTNPDSALTSGNPEMISVMTTDMNLNETVPGSGRSFTNMLNMQVQGQNLLGLGGFHGYGIWSGFEELELGFGGTRSWEIPGADYGSVGAVGTSTSGCNTWQMIDSDEQGGNGGGMVGEDCFPWPGLAISTLGKGLK